jgi:uncharacterized secreted protein with C-terminal beta-propeller domain
MTFDEKIFLAVDDIVIPESISPENMELMLRSRRTANTVNRKEPASVKKNPITVSHNITNKRKDAAFKIVASIAACFVLLTGVLIYRNGEQEKPGFDDIIQYADIPAPQIPSSYAELYEVYTSLQLDETPTAQKPTAFTLDGTDIVKSSNGFIYTLRDETLYIINPEESVIAATVSSRFSPPLEMYIADDNLFLISNEKSDTSFASASSIFIEIYDVSDPYSPTKISDYSQCGSFTSGNISDGRLVLVSSYSDYRTVPLDGETDLAGFVPYYTINGSSFFIGADSIYVPANASSTDYTVVSAIDCGSPEKVTVKAVLGQSGDAYLTDESLFVYGKGLGSFTVISKFNLIDDSFDYLGSCSIDGLIPGREFINESDGLLRVITTGYDENKNISENLYLLDRNMNVSGTLGAILPGETVTDVWFADGLVLFYTLSKDTPAFAVDSSSLPPTSVPELNFVSGDIYAVGDKLLSLSKAEAGFMLSLYSRNGILINSTVFAAEEGKVYSGASDDSRSVYIDDEGYVGIPVHSFDEFGTKNSYYIFKISDNEINLETVLNYSDIDDSNIFERAIRMDDSFVVIGGSRVVWVRISDWKVLSVMSDFFTR